MEHHSKETQGLLAFFVGLTDPPGFPKPANQKMASAAPQHFLLNFDLFTCLLIFCNNSKSRHYRHSPMRLRY